MEKKEPTFGYAFFTVVASFAVVMVPALAWNCKIHPLFLLSYLIALPLCLRLGVPYKELQAGMVQSVNKAIIPIMILLINGGLVGTWNAAGTVPLIVNLGIKMISPSIFLVATFFLCILASLATGTSWGTCGTAGLALAGVGLGMGINPMLTAGAVCSGAFFGDAMSPLSDGPNLCSAITGVDVFVGIKHTLRVTIPSAVICAVLYLVIGLNLETSSVDYGAIHEMSHALEANFHLGFIQVIPMIVVFGMLATKKPSIPSLLTGAFVGGVIACVLEGKPIADVISYFWGGYSIESGNEMVDTLLNRGGITSMTATVTLFIFAFGLFGVLSAAGIIDALVEPLTKRLKSSVSIVMTTVLMSLLGDAIGTSTNCGYVFGGNIMVSVYERAKLEKVNLTRALTVGSTVMGILIPWNMSAIVAAGYLGVTPSQLAPYSFFAWITPVVLLIVTILGFDTKYISKE